MKNLSQPVDHPDYRYESAPAGTLLSLANPHDRFDLEMMEQQECRLLEEQIHDMYIRYMMKRLEGCQYGEFNGNAVIGLDKIKYAFECDLKLLNMSYEHEGYDQIKARSKTGDTYLFHVNSSSYKGSLERLLWSK